MKNEQKQSEKLSQIKGDSCSNITIETEESVKQDPAIIEEDISSKNNQTPENLLQNLVQSILSNAENIPCDPKFPYLDEFKNKINPAQFRQIQDIVTESNNQITKASNQNLIFNGGSSIIGGGANLTNYGIVASGGVALPWLAAISTVPAMVNFLHKVKNGVNLNAYLEGRGYLLKYCENVTIMLICDVASRIAGLDSEESKKAATEKLKQALTNLQDFNLAHYDPEPFYYKWSAQAFRQGLSNALSGARFGLGVASIAGSVIAPPVGIAITGAWLGSEAVGGCLYKKSHNLRNQKSIEAAQNLDNVFKNIFTIYKENLGFTTNEQVQELELAISPDKAKEQLKKLYKTYDIPAYQQYQKAKPKKNHQYKHCTAHGHKKEEHKHCAAHSHKEEEDKHSHQTDNHNEEGHKHCHQTHSNHKGHKHSHSNNQSHHHHQHHSHSHNYQHRYFEGNCKHNLGEKISAKNVKFGQLATVKVKDGNKNTLPLHTHVHFPKLTKVYVVQEISNCYNNIAKKGANIIEKATGCIGKSFSYLSR